MYIGLESSLGLKYSKVNIWKYFVKTNKQKQTNKKKKNKNKTKTKNRKTKQNRKEEDAEDISRTTGPLNARLVFIHFNDFFFHTESK